MSEKLNGPCVNTDRELWREPPGDYYANSIHVTEHGGIGINVGGMVFVKSLRHWHEFANDAAAAEERGRRRGLEEALEQAADIADSYGCDYAARSIRALAPRDSAPACDCEATLWQGGHSPHCATLKPRDSRKATATVSADGVRFRPGVPVPAPLLISVHEALSAEARVNFNNGDVGRSAYLESLAFELREAKEARK